MRPTEQERYFEISAADLRDVFAVAFRFADNRVAGMCITDLPDWLEKPIPEFNSQESAFAQAMQHVLAHCWALTADVISGDNMPAVPAIECRKLKHELYYAAFDSAECDWHEIVNDDMTVSEFKRRYPDWYLDIDMYGPRRAGFSTHSARNVYVSQARGMENPRAREFYGDNESVKLVVTLSL